MNAPLPVRNGKPDRSDAHHRLIATRIESGLTLGVTIAVAATYPPTREKYAGRIPGEVARDWGKKLPENEQRSSSAKKCLAALPEAEMCSAVVTIVEGAQADIEAGRGAETASKHVAKLVWAAGKGHQGVPEALSGIRRMLARALPDDEAAAGHLVDRALGGRDVAKTVAKGAPDPQQEHRCRPASVAGLGDGEQPNAAARSWPERTWDDQGNGQRLVDHHGRNLRYVADSGCWAVYDGAVWSTVGTRTQVLHCAQQVIDSLPSTEAFNYSSARPAR